jgi:hypothetical protein
MTDMPEETKTTQKDAAESPFWIYRGHPLVRCGDQLYYGSLTDPFVVWLKIASYKEVKARNGATVLQAADKVIVTLMSTDPDLGAIERVQQRCERRGLYNAIDIASVWLERALKKAA